MTEKGKDVDGSLERERQGKTLHPPKECSTFEGLEEIAKLVHAKGCYFHRGTSHAKEEAIQKFLDGCEEEDFPFGEFSAAQFLVAPPVEESDCDESDCDDEACVVKNEEKGAEQENPSTQQRQDQITTLASMDMVRKGCSKLVEDLPESFREDIRKDAEALANLSNRLCPQAPWLTMRLEVVQEHLCSRWHQDGYVSRSLITYVGPGTCCADDHKVKWDELLKTADDETNDSVVSKQNITQMPTNAVLLIKGDSWPGICGKGLTHKSPTDHGGASPPKRLLLKVDLHNVRPLLADDEDPFLMDDGEGSDSEEGEGNENENDVEEDSNKRQKVGS